MFYFSALRCLSSFNAKKIELQFSMRQVHTCFSQSRENLRDQVSQLLFGQVMNLMNRRKLALPDIVLDCWCRPCCGWRRRRDCIYCTAGIGLSKLGMPRKL